MGGQEAVMAATATAASPVAVAPTLLAPGFRFHPTDEELVRYYLRRKACGKPFRFQAVTEIDVYKSEPWELAEHSSLKTRDMEWYFFSPVDRKYGNGSRLNRATGKGYWKATGKDRAVRHQTQTIGMKKTLVFHSGRAPDGKRTNWVMHEYRLCDSELKNAGVIQDAFVLCRIFQKSGLGPPNGDRYAPFVEEEWNDNDASIFIPEDDGAANGDEARIDLDEDTGPLTIAPPQPDNTIKPQALPLMCKRERSEEPELSLSQTKRSKQDDDPSSSQHHPNGSEDSITTATATAATTTTTKIMSKNFTSSSSVIEFPLLDPPPAEHSPNNRGNESLNFGSSNLEKSVPPGYLKFISNLENEILNVSMERETLKIEVMRAQAMINVLQSHVEVLAKENEGLRRAQHQHHHHHGA